MDEATSRRVQEILGETEAMTITLAAYRDELADLAERLTVVEDDEAEDSADNEDAEAVGALADCIDEAVSGLELMPDFAR